MPIILTLKTNRDNYTGPEVVELNSSDPIEPDEEEIVNLISDEE